MHTPVKLDLKNILSTDNLKIAEISLGGYHTIFRLSNGSIYGCGDNSKGQLGLGNYVTPISQLTKIT